MNTTHSILVGIDLLAIDLSSSIMFCTDIQLNKTLDTIYSLPIGPLVQVIGFEYDVYFEGSPAPLHLAINEFLSDGYKRAGSVRFHAVENYAKQTHPDKVFVITDGYHEDPSADFNYVEIKI